MLMEHWFPYLCVLARKHDSVHDLGVRQVGIAPRRPGILALATASILVVLAAVAVAPGLVAPGAGLPAGSGDAGGAAATDAALPKVVSPGAPAEVESPPPRTPEPAAPLGASAIVPGTVNRTSINLEATYDANVELGYGDRSLRVDVTLSVTNRSGAGIDRVELNTITGPLGNLRLRLVEVDGAAVTATVEDQSILVALGGILPNNATATVRVKLRATFRSSLSGSSWMFTRTNGILQANRWLPWVGLRRSFDRPNHGDPFFTALSPLIRVRITSDRTLKIATPGARVSHDGLTQTFEARNVRDFPIVASPHFSVRERQVDGRTLRAFVRTGFPTSTVFDYAADGLKRMSELAGAYPYSRFVIAQTAGGYALEGPGMIWVPTGMSGSSLRWNVYHETAHQWFYGIVGSDGARDPYADEASATHLGGVASGIWRATSCPERRLDLSIYRYSNACYFGQIYVQGADVLREVRRAMGSAAYWRGIREYVADHRFKIGSTEALFETLQANTGVNLRPILEPRFPSLY
jgi:hypothetical protein